MKTVVILFFSLLITKSCSKENKQDLEKTTIEYIATTRGFYQKTTIINQEVFVTKDRNSQEKGTSYKISDAEWKKLIALFSKVDLDQLSTYKDPTQKRFYDGAPIARMKIVYQEKEYETLPFDHKYPPVEIVDFVNKVVNLGEK